MIESSRSRERLVARPAVAALLMAAAVSVASCSWGAPCSGTHCGAGLDVIFVLDAFDGGAPANPLNIDIAAQTDQTFLSFMTCSLPTTGTLQLVCASDSQRQYSAGGNQLQFPGTSIGAFRVTVSAAGQQLSQRVYTPDYWTYECGCGLSATSATTLVHLPSQQP